MNKVTNHSSISLESFSFPSALELLVLAPHPDDFDAIGVTLRFFRDNGNPVHIVVATSGASGVEDSFCSSPTLTGKTALREKEQRASCKFFGLPETNLEFLRLTEDEAGHPLHNVTHTERIRQAILTRRPALVFLPHGHDTNPGHQRIYAMYHQIAQEAGYPLAAFLNRDPKTIEMRSDVFLGFGEKAAAWKAELLRFHQSQHQRNLNQRGHGLDDRILSVNRQSAEECGSGTQYAEEFELELFRVSRLADIVGEA
jgi:LmbE family N-acetylglucosaminyl deacetylase